MATKKFPSEMSSRGTVKVTDKLMICNIDTGATEYTTVSELFATITTALALKAPIANPVFTGGIITGGVAFSETSPVSTGININAGISGASYILLATRQYGAGDATQAAIYLLRCGYSGNNFTVTFIGGTDIFTFTQSGGILYVTNASGGNCHLSIIGS